MRKFFDFLEKTFLMLSLVFPFGFILSLHSMEFVHIFAKGNPSDHIRWIADAGDGRPFFLLVFALAILVLSVMFSSGYSARLRAWFSFLPDYIHILLIFVVAIGIRLYFLSIVKTQPVSDFELINKDAQALFLGDSPTRMYVASHVAITMVYGALYRLFGFSLIVPQLFHALLYAFSGMFLYLAGKYLMGGSREWGVLAGFAMALWPSLAIYSNVLTPEHVFIFLLCMLFYILARYFAINVNEDGLVQMRGMSDLLFFLFVGFVLGFMSLFRPFGALFLAAFVAVIVLKANRISKQLLLNLFLCLVMYWFMGRIPDAVAGYYSNSFLPGRPCNLLVGLNMEYDGQYNQQDFELCGNILAESSSDEEITKKVLRISMERLYQGRDQFLAFIFDKFSILWANSNGILFWAFQPPVETLKDDNVFVKVQRITLVDYSLMLTGSILCFLGLMSKVSKKIPPLVLFCVLIFTAFNFMEVPFEVQTRYRTIVMPVFICLACWGGASLSSFVTILRNSSQLNKTGD